MQALVRLGHDVRGIDTVAPWKHAAWLTRQAQRRLGRGSVVNEINRSILAVAHEFRPNMIWAEKQEFLRAETVATLRKLDIRLIHFTPDPYFSLDWKRTRLMDRAMGAFDVLVYCKAYEHREYAKLGRPLLYMPLGYCDEVHRPLPSDDPRWHCAASFLGGWEPRREHLLRNVAAAGIDLKIRGGYWSFLCDGKWSLRRQLILKQLAGGDSFQFHRDELLAQAWQGDEVYADDYARAVSGAKIGLGLLRRVCPDQHTTRTFEIPACGSMLLADRTDEHSEFFAEGREAEFFASGEELIDKLRFYDRHDGARERVAEAGRQRCIDGEYAYVHRLSTALGAIQKLQ